MHVNQTTVQKGGNMTMLAVPYVCAYVAAGHAGDWQIQHDILLEGAARRSRPWIDLLLATGRSSVLTPRAFSYQAALLYAACRDHFIIVDTLIRHGHVDVNEQFAVTHAGRTGTQTALTNAIKYNSVNALQTLLDAGASTRTCCSLFRNGAVENCSPVDLAVAHGTPRTLGLVLAAEWDRARE